MSKKVILIAVIIILLIVVAIFFITRTSNDNKTNPNYPSNSSRPESNLSDEERVLEDSRVIEQSNTNFMERSGFELVKTEGLQGVTYDKIYSQNKDKAQVNIDFNGKKASLFVSKTSLFNNVEDEEPAGYFIADTEVTFVVGDDGIKNYYYEKNNMYFQISTTDAFENDEIGSLIKGFDTKIGDNY